MFSGSSKTHSALAAGLVALCCLYAGWRPARVGAQARPDRAQPRSSGVSARSFRADLTIRHHRMLAGGVALRHQSPVLVMRVERSEHAGRWRTALVVDQPPAAMVDTPAGRSGLANPFQVTRVEFEDDEEVPRMYNRAGQRVAAVSEKDLVVFGVSRTVRGLPRMTGRGFAGGLGGGLLAEAGRRNERRQDLHRRFGPPVERVRGLDRFVMTTAGGGKHEILADPETALPVELTVGGRSGAVARTTMRYEALGGRGHIRRHTRTEHDLGDAGRSVTEVAVSNVVVSDEAEQ